jgi:hypothetical protein
MKASAILLASIFSLATSSLSQAALSLDRIKVYTVTKGGSTALSYTLNGRSTYQKDPLAIQLEIQCADPTGGSIGIFDVGSNEYFYKFDNEVNCFTVQQSLYSNFKKKKISCLVLRNFKNPYGGTYLYPAVEAASSCKQDKTL